MLIKPVATRSANRVITARQLISLGPKIVMVKHLAHAGLDPENSFEMLMVTRNEAWYIKTPLLHFDRAPVGVGDLTSGCLLVNLLHGAKPKVALERTASAYFEVMRVTSELEE